MPLRGENHSRLVKDETPYFDSLSELDTWFSLPHDELLGVVPYKPRPRVGGGRAKLLVCHDYKGGYTESPSGLCYTFNFWRLCDAFVYFSHRRVTVPPSGWTNAAHKQGTRMLGTLIFEGNTADTLQLVVGHSGFTTTDNKIPVSKRYAVLLAELAHQRGFDGYLLNFESSLRYGTNEARALTSWILLLRAELNAKIGPHAEVMWYDSVIYDGVVSYQNRLNAYNLPFFLASDSLFTNYWWQPDTQGIMSTYFTNVKSGSSAAATKTLQDIHTGIDVYGRRQYGGGGFFCYRALTYTSPLGISTALFAPGWTWESATPNPERDWNAWWENERKLWLGPYNIPPPNPPEGRFKPITDFFQDLPPPDPARFAFYTHFSPGVGYSWFVDGRRVLESTENGWTDIDKQCSIGNLVWPRPTPSWEGFRNPRPPPTASSALDMTDGYNGGNALKLTIGYIREESNDTQRVIWLPVQSLTVTTRETFEVRVAYKATQSRVALRLQVHIKLLPNEENNDVVLDVNDNHIESDLPNGWTSQVTNFTCTSTRQPLSSVVIGFIIATRIVAPWDPFPAIEFSLSLGQLAVYPGPLPSVSVGIPSVTEAKFAARWQLPKTDPTEGVLTWDAVSTLVPITVQRPNEESPTPVWLLQDTPAYRSPTFIYFNIYVAQLDKHGNADPANAVFIGTTGYDGRANRFYVEPQMLPPGLRKPARVRFYVQGVTDRGEALPWDRCASVDHRSNGS